MTVLPDDRFPLPDDFGPGSVWADRVGHRSLIGCTQKGIEIPIGHGDDEVSPGELLKLALIGCAGMSSDHALGRRLGDDYDTRLWAHGLSDPEENRYVSLVEEIQLDLGDLSDEEARVIASVFRRAVAAGCTVERTVVPGAPVEHRILDLDTPIDENRPLGDENANSEAAQA